MIESSFDSLLQQLKKDLEHLAELHSLEVTRAFEDGLTGGKSATSLEGIRASSPEGFDPEASLASSTSPKTLTRRRVSQEPENPLYTCSIDDDSKEQPRRANLRSSVRRSTCQRRFNKWVQGRRSVLETGHEPLWQETCPRGVLNPKSVLRRSWDLVLLFLVVLDAMFLPFHAAYASHAAQTFDGIWLLLLTVSFTVEIVLRFSTAYKAGKEDSDLVPGTMVTDRARIARKYLKGWFWIDLMCTIPWRWIAQALGPVSDLAMGAKWVRALRMLRLLRLARFFGKNGVLEKLESKIVSYTTLQVLVLFRVILTMACICHWNACFWWMIGRKDCPLLHFIPETYKQTFESLPHWTSVEVGHPNGETWSWIDQNNLSAYLFCFYWTLGVMRTMPTEVLPVNLIERLYVMLFMFLAFSVFGVTVAQVVAIYTKFSERERVFKEEALAVRAYLDRLNAPYTLKDDVLAFLHHLFENRLINAKELSMLKYLPKDLADELKYVQLKPHLSKVGLFRQLAEPLLMCISEIAEVQSLPPGFLLSTHGEVAEGTWIVILGNVRVLWSESENADDLLVVDQECLTSMVPTESPQTTIAITCAQVIWISRDGLVNTAMQNPGLSEFLRKQSLLQGSQELTEASTENDPATPLIGRLSSWRERSMTFSFEHFGLSCDSCGC